MHTLLLNGSPRKEGGTSSIVRALMERLEGEVTYMEAYRTNVSPCIDCRYCWTHPACAIDDAMQTAYRAIDCADQIVIASPIYFAELTGPLFKLGKPSAIPLRLARVPSCALSDGKIPPRRSNTGRRRRWVLGNGGGHGPPLVADDGRDV